MATTLNYIGKHKSWVNIIEFLFFNIVLMITKMTVLFDIFCYIPVVVSCWPQNNLIGTTIEVLLLSARDNVLMWPIPKEMKRVCKEAMDSHLSQENSPQFWSIKSRQSCSKCSWKCFMATMKKHKCPSVLISECKLYA